MKPTHSRSFTDGGGDAGTVRTRPLRILSPIVHNAKSPLLSQYRHKSSQTRASVVLLLTGNFPKTDILKLQRVKRS